jgi:MoxR-like ATPase
MATSANTVVSIDTNNRRITFRTDTGREYKTHISMLSKNELIKVGSFLQVKWNGTPMHKTVAEIAGIVDEALAQFKSVPQPTVEKPIVRTSEPVPAKAVPVNESLSLDAMMKIVVANIMSTMPVGIDENAVRNIVSDVVDPIAMDHAVALDRLSSKIDAMQPKVTQIVIKDRPTVTLKGVQHKAFADIMMSISARCNTFLVGPAGTGKTTMVQQVADALGLRFHAENLTAATTEYSLKGFTDANSGYKATPLRELFANGGVYLLDEIDNANPNVLGVLNSALSNGFMAFPDGMVQKHPEFIAVAAGNTYGNGATAEYVGRNPIDGATLDRFAFFNVDIDEAVEDAMLAGFGLPTATATAWVNAVRKSRQNVADSGLRVIVSPRATANGAGLLAQGMDMDKVYSATVLKGAKHDQVEKIRQGVTLTVAA